MAYQIVFLFLIFFTSVMGGPARFSQLSGSDGLSQNSVTAILQDQSGRLWFATRDGLNVFDGYTFRIFKHDPNDSGSLSENNINAILEDQSGKIWVGTQGSGLNVFSPETEKFSRPFAGKIPGQIIRVLLADKNGAIWVGTDDAGLSRVDLATGSVLNYKASPDGSLSFNRIRGLAQDANGRIWIGTYGGGLNCLIPETGEVKWFQSGSSGLSENRIWSLISDKNGILWAGTFGGGLNRIDPKTEKITVIRPDSKNPAADKIWALREDHLGRIWIGTYGAGVFRLEADQKTMSKIEMSRPGVLQHHEANIFSLFEDRSNLLWVGTETGGLFKTDLKPSKFGVLNNETVSGLLNHTGVMSVLVDKEKRLWIGTLGGGLTRYSPETGQIIKLTTNSHPAALSGNFVLSLLEDGNSIWVGTGSGLGRINKESLAGKKYKSDENNPLTVGSDDIRVLFKDEKSRIWVGTNGGGLSRFDEATETFTRFRHADRGLASNTVRSLFGSATGSLWIGTSGGLNQFNPETGIWKTWKSQENEAGSLSDNEIRCMYEDEAGKLWVGTAAGLNQFDAEKNKFLHFLEKDGLPNGYIYGILPDQTGNLWLSTNFGLSKFNPESGKFKNYDESDGLQANEFNGGAWFKGSDGLLFFGGVGGLTVFQPGAVSENQFLPQIILTDFKILNQPVLLPVALSFLDSYTLKPRQNMISFEFAALDFTNPQKNKYKYQLVGFDEDWIQAGNRRYVTYTNLDPGDYTFRVTGSNNDGVWNETGTSLYLIVRPPFYKTTWFIALVIVALISGVYFFGRWRQAVKERREKERIEVIRQVTIGVLHEIRQPLQILNGNIEVISLLNQGNEPELDEPVKKAGENVTRIKNLLRKLEELLNDAKFKTKSYTKDQQMIDLTGDNL
ncbi:MAG: hypothetical protein J0L62_12150 [Bacteroidetes bacterium]|nr:hypothetical protein [Bacteroidota bacterium]